MTTLWVCVLLISIATVFRLAYSKAKSTNPNKLTARSRLADFEDLPYWVNDPDNRRSLVEQVKSDLLEVVDTVQEELENALEGSGIPTKVRAIIQRYLGEDDTDELRRILYDLSSLLRESWSYDTTVYPNFRSSFETPTRKDRHSLTVRFTEEKGSRDGYTILAQANSSLNITTLSFFTLSDPGLLPPPIDDALDALKASSLDPIFTGMVPRFLHELCHIIDPKIVDVQISTDHLPAGVSPRQSRFYNEGHRTLKTYDDFGCRLLGYLTYRGRRGVPPAYTNAESVTRAILTIYSRVRRAPPDCYPILLPQEWNYDGETDDESDLEWEYDSETGSISDSDEDYDSEGEYDSEDEYDNETGSTNDWERR